MASSSKTIPPPTETLYEQNFTALNAAPGAAF